MLLTQLPALTQFYGLRPADLDHMTVREISEYVVQLERYRAEQDAEARRSGRG